MFFLKMISRSFSRQFKRRLLIAVTVCLSATVSVAMLGVVFDVGDKLNAELSTYGSNIVVQPKSDAVVSDLYNTGDSAGSASGSSSGSDGGSTSDGPAAADSADPTAFLKESDAQKIKTIFWAFNITNFAPELNIHADAGCVGSGAGSAGSAGTAGASGAAASAAKCKATNVPIVGTWFAKTLHMDSGESTVAGMNGMRSWWKINGTWPKDDSEQAMVGSALAAKLGVNVGDSVTLDKTIAVGADDNTNGGTGKTGKSSTERNRVKVKIVGIFDSGDSDNSAIYMPSIAAQTLANLPNSIDKIEVKALTTPDNDLARKASKNPNALTQDEWETWYCTAYPSSIAYQIEEVLPGAVAKQVRQVAALQGDVLNKTQAVMVLMTVLSLVRRDRRGEPDGRVDWRTRFGIGAVEGDRRHGRRGFAPYARRNGGDFAGWCDCRRAAWLGRCTDRGARGVRLGHHHASDGVRVGFRVVGGHCARGLAFVDSGDSGLASGGGAAW